MAGAVISGFILGFGAFQGTVFLIKKLRQKKQCADESIRLKDTTFILSNTIESGMLREDIFSLVDNRKTGAFHVFIGRRKGYILFKNGVAYHIFYREQTGIDALGQLLEQKQGRYFFEPRPVNHPRIFHDDIKELLSMYNSTTNRFQIK
jgi:hypothetical protein